MANVLYLPESTIKAFFKWTNFHGYQKVTPHPSSTPPPPKKKKNKIKATFLFLFKLILSPKIKKLELFKKGLLCISHYVFCEFVFPDSRTSLVLYPRLSVNKKDN